MKRFLRTLSVIGTTIVCLTFAAGVTSAASSYIFTTVLSQGMSGQGVTALQTVLKQQGYYTYPTITGYFGPSTRAAVMAFQRAKGLSQVGSVGPQTRAALNSINGSIVTPAPQPLPTATKTFARSLSFGATGTDVALLQTLLKREGVYTAAVTSQFDATTQRAVTAFQEKYRSEILTPNKLTAGTGQVGVATLSKLNALASEQPIVVADNLQNCPVPDISSAASASASVNSPFSYTITATGNPTSYQASNLPAGLSLYGQTISGTPTTAGTYNVTIRAINSCNTDTRNLLITVASAGTPTVSLTTSTSTISSGSSAVLTWSSTNASTCVATGDWNGTKSFSGSENTGALTSSKTYILNCTGSGGVVVRQSVVITVNPIVITNNPTPAPTVTISSNLNNLTSGKPITLSWSSTNATSCTGSGNWSGIKTTSGTQTTATITDDKKYTLTCIGPGGTASSSIKVNYVFPIVTLTVSPSPVLPGNPVTVTWVGDDVTSCTASGSWNGTKPPSGSEIIPNVTSLKTFTIDCTGPAGDADQETTLVSVINTGVLPTVTLSQVFSDVLVGGVATLRWSTSNALYCEASGGWSGSKTLSGTEFSPRLNADTTFNLACGGPGGTTTKSLTVTVTSTPPPTPENPPASVDISGVTAQNILVVYNSLYPESVALKDYYIAHRPGFANVNTVAITPPANEYVAYSVYKSDIETPVKNWISQNPDKQIKIIVLMNRIPTHSIEAATPSTQMGLYNATGAYVTSLDMGSQAASIAYIDKISNGSDLIISGSALGKSGSTYYLDAVRPTTYPETVIENTRGALLAANSSASIVFQNASHITNASNVLGYETWGANGGQNKDYALDGSVVFSGNSNWYLIKTVESFNGQYTDYNQGNVIKWFSSNAFGGSNYSNTPVGAVTHTSEPYVSGVNTSYYMKMWEQGRTLVEAAWASRQTPFFAAIGDPLVKK